MRIFRKFDVSCWREVMIDSYGSSMVEWISKRAIVTWLRDRRGTRKKGRNEGEKQSQRRRRRSATDRRRSVNWRRREIRACAQLQGATPNTQTGDESLGKMRRDERTPCTNRGKCKSHLRMANQPWCTIGIVKISE